MNTQHTPGPWEAREVPSFRTIGIAQKGMADCHVLVAVLSHQDPATARANATLVMAAPDLLRLLDALIPLAESRAEDLDEIATDTEGDDNFDAQHKAQARTDADEAWAHVEEARKLRASIWAGGAAPVQAEEAPARPLSRST